LYREPPWLTARQSYEQKIVPTLGHSTSRFNKQFLDERSICQSFEIASRANTAEIRKTEIAGREME
jgi:hypothetical protein